MSADEPAPDGTAAVDTASQTKVDVGMPDTRGADAEAADARTEPNSGSCVSEQFTGKMEEWLAKPEGGQWEHHDGEFARQTSLSLTHALVQSSADFGTSFVASTSGKVTALKWPFPGYVSTVGLSLLIRTGDSGNPHRQVACCLIFDSFLLINVGFYLLDGSSPGGSAYANWSASRIPRDDPYDMEYRVEFKVSQDNGTTTAECKVTTSNGTMAASRDITSFVDSLPLGVALHNRGVAADFDNVQVCPANP